MTWDRIHRQEAILREKIAIIVLDRLNDPRLGFVTITGVELSRDRRHCRVLYTVLGTESEQRTTARALADAVPRVQELLAPTLETRLIPAIRFDYDESVERESRLLGLMDSLASERGEREGRGAEGDASGAPGPADGPEVGPSREPGAKD